MIKIFRCENCKKPTILSERRLVKVYLSGDREDAQEWCGECAAKIKGAPPVKSPDLAELFKSGQIRVK